MMMGEGRLSIKSMFITCIAAAVVVSWIRLMITSNTLVEVNVMDELPSVIRLEHQDETVDESDDPLVSKTDVEKEMAVEEDQQHHVNTTQIFEEARRNKIRVGLLYVDGVSKRSYANLKHILACHKDLFQVRTMPKVTTDRLDKLDVVIYPGGSGGLIFNALVGTKNKVRSFVKKGGGYLGICAGAYLAKGYYRFTPYGRSAGMLGGGYMDSVSFNPKLTEFPFLGPINNDTFAGQKLFYMNGPFFKKSETSERLIGKRVELARVSPNGSLRIYKSLRARGRSKEVTHVANKAMLVASKYGQGTVVLSTGHPESDITATGVLTPECDSKVAKLLLDLVMIAGNKTDVFH